MPAAHETLLRQLHVLSYKNGANVPLRSCSDAGIHDYTVVRELLKDIAQSQTMDLGQAKAFKGASSLRPSSSTLPLLLRLAPTSMRACAKWGPGAET